jgi:hypothetical protein
MDWSKLYGDMDPHGTYVKVQPSAFTVHVM